MAEFEVKVVKINNVYEHPNADRLTLVEIGGYNCIANKHEDGSWRYQPGDKVVYIPEQSIVPENILKEMNLWNYEAGKGMLAGSLGNRVKAIKLRGIYSEGLLYPVSDLEPVEVNTNVAERLGIVKYEPPIPTEMSGEVFYFGRPPVKFDVEPWEKYPNLFYSDEPVVITEKLHGTFTGISYYPGLNNAEAFQAPNGSNDILIWSKGLGAKGLVFKNNETNILKNIYVRAWQSLNTEPVWNWLTKIAANYQAIHLLGETYGKGIQDLDYNTNNPEFRLFLIGVSEDGHNVDWIDPNAMFSHAKEMGIETVPVLHTGFFDWKDLPNLRDGKTTLGGNHIREGVVIYPMVPRVDPEFGPVRLKAVSPAYKLRKNGTEYN